MPLVDAATMAALEDGLRKFAGEAEAQEEDEEASSQDKHARVEMRVAMQEEEDASAAAGHGDAMTGFSEEDVKDAAEDEAAAVEDARRQLDSLLKVEILTNVKASTANPSIFEKDGSIANLHKHWC